MTPPAMHLLRKCIFLQPVLSVNDCRCKDTPASLPELCEVISVISAWQEKESLTLGKHPCSWMGERESEVGGPFG